MSFGKVLVAITVILLLQPNTFATENDSLLMNNSGFIGKVKSKSSAQTPKSAVKISDKFKNLRTTYIPGVYCQQVDDFGKYTRQKHYFYNTKTEQMIEIPNLYHINSIEDLGSYKETYDLYGAKSDTFTQKGKTYKIPTII